VVRGRALADLAEVVDCFAALLAQDPASEQHQVAEAFVEGLGAAAALQVRSGATSPRGVVLLALMTQDWTGLLDYTPGIYASVMFGKCLVWLLASLASGHNIATTSSQQHVLLLPDPRKQLHLHNCNQTAAGFSGVLLDMQLPQASKQPPPRHGKGKMARAEDGSDAEDSEEADEADAGAEGQAGSGAEGEAEEEPVDGAAGEEGEPGPAAVARQRALRQNNGTGSLVAFIPAQLSAVRTLSWQAFSYALLPPRSSLHAA